MFNSQFFKKLPQLAGVAALASTTTVFEKTPAPVYHQDRAFTHKQMVKRHHKRRISSRSRAINRGR